MCRCWSTGFGQRMNQRDARCPSFRTKNGLHPLRSTPLDLREVLGPSMDPTPPAYPVTEILAPTLRSHHILKNTESQIMTRCRTYGNQTVATLVTKYDRHLLPYGPPIGDGNIVKISRWSQDPIGLYMRVRLIASYMSCKNIIA